MIPREQVRVRVKSQRWDLNGILITATVDRPDTRLYLLVITRTTAVGTTAIDITSRMHTMRSRIHLLYSSSGCGVYHSAAMPWRRASVFFTSESIRVGAVVE